MCVVCMYYIVCGVYACAVCAYAHVWCICMYVVCVCYVVCGVHAHVRCVRACVVCVCPSVRDEVRLCEVLFGWKERRQLWAPDQAE